MKTQVPRLAALAVAQQVEAVLAPFCERIAIAGSIRRQRPEVSDIELLFVAKTQARPDGLFDSAQVDLAAEHINLLLANGILAKRPNARGAMTWGPQNKLAVHVASGIALDLFSTPAAHWWTSLVIRTGPKNFNLRLIEALGKHGYSLHAYGNGSGIEHRTGGKQIVASEADIFRLAGWKYLEPDQRKD